jgi:outer membrane protein OmpA-like peptidoglycan-associated protein
LDFGANWLVANGNRFPALGIHNPDYKPWVDFDRTQFMWGGALGKWFSPVWGLRISGGNGVLQGLGNIPGTTDNRFSYTQATGDFMVNLKTLFLPYKSKGFFDPVVYAGMGYSRTWGNRNPSDPFMKFAKSALDLMGSVFYDLAEENAAAKATGRRQSLVGKAGLQLNFRIFDPVQLFIGAEALAVNAKFNRIGNPTGYAGVVSGNVGLTYRFGFRHFIKAEFSDQSVIDALIQENNDLRSRIVPCPPPVECPKCPEPETPPVLQDNLDKVGSGSTVALDPVFFAINSSVVRDVELKKVAAAAEFLMNNPDKKLELVGYADKKTGTAAYNMQISKRRADAVAKMLIEKHKIAKNRLIVSYKGDTVQPFAKNEDNRVTIFVK